jgi:ubiquinol-cytochrome c reductase iron-sulfur subunit
MFAGANQDGVQIVHRRDRFPIPGTKAEKRAELAVSLAFGISFLAAIAFIIVFVAVPFEFHMPGKGSQTFVIYTPLLGALLGISLLAVGAGAVLWAKWLMPEEEAVQDRHDGPSPVEEQMLTSATLISGLDDTGLARRSLLKSSLGLAGVGLGIVPLVALVGVLSRATSTDHAVEHRRRWVPNGAGSGPGDLQPAASPAGSPAEPPRPPPSHPAPPGRVGARRGRPDSAGRLRRARRSAARRMPGIAVVTTACSACHQSSSWSPRCGRLRPGRVPCQKFTDHGPED